jgi:LysR family transcriptional activator of nhaA
MLLLNYHHLYYFWTVARSGSIAAATQRLHLSQSALSLQLKELERSCKARLLERSRRGVALTPEGRTVFEHCERIFPEGEELTALIQNGFQAPALLRLGVRPTVSRDAALRAMAFVKEVERACRVTVISAEPEDLMARLKARSIDLLISNRDYAPALGEGYRSRLVSRLPVYFVASRAIKSVVRSFPADLKKTVLLLRPSDNPVRRQVDQFLSRRGVSCSVAADSDDVDLLRRLALEGFGVAVLSALSVASDLKTGRLALLHAAPVGIEEQVWFVCDARPHANPTVRRALDGLMDRFALFGKVPGVRSLLGRSAGMAR